MVSDARICFLRSGVSIFVSLKAGRECRAKYDTIKSSGSWLREHFDDSYVQRAWAEGRRSRASFKLEEVQVRDRLINKGDVVVDLGAAPGGGLSSLLDG